MRIVGGREKGRKLLAPRGGKLRITADRVKESLFDILYDVEGRSFLDLFAGSGNVGIEALSRVCAPVLFVESDARHADTIEKNLTQCRFRADYEIVRRPVESAVPMFRKREDAFDIIFADPPYERALVEKTIQLLERFPILSEDGIIVLEHSVKEMCMENKRFMMTDQRQYGDTVLSFLKTITKE